MKLKFPSKNKFINFAKSKIEHSAMSNTVQASAKWKNRNKQKLPRHRSVTGNKRKAKNLNLAISLEWVHLSTIPLCHLIVYYYYFANGKMAAQSDEPLAKFLHSVRDSIRFQVSWTPKSQFLLHSHTVFTLPHVFLITASWRMNVYCPKKGETFVSSITYNTQNLLRRKPSPLH